MNILYFYDSKKTHRFMGFGQAVILSLACYFKGKELGYDRILFEWHNMVTYPYWTDESTFKGIINTPKNSNMPIMFMSKGDRIPS